MMEKPETCITMKEIREMNREERVKVAKSIISTMSSVQDEEECHKPD